MSCWHCPRSPHRSVLVASLVPDKVGDQTEYSRVLLGARTSLCCCPSGCPSGPWSRGACGCWHHHACCPCVSTAAHSHLCVQGTWAMWLLCPCQVLGQSSGSLCGGGRPRGGMRPVFSQHLCWCPGVPVGLLMRPKAQWSCSTLVLLQVLL